MAAHSVTFLIQAANEINWDEETREKYIFGMDRAPAMGELAAHDWSHLRRSLFDGESDKQIKDTILVILHDQIETWIDLGYPETHREWAEAYSAREES